MGSKKKSKATDAVSSNSVSSRSVSSSKAALTNHSMVQLNSNTETGQMDRNLQRAIRAEKRLLELNHRNLVSQIQQEIEKKEGDTTQRLQLYGAHNSARQMEVRREFTDYIEKKDCERKDLEEFYSLCKKALDHGITYDDLVDLGYPDNRSVLSHHIQGQLIVEKPPPTKSTSQPVVENKVSGQRLDWAAESENENVEFLAPKVADLRNSRFDNVTLGANNIAVSLDDFTIEESTRGIVASIPSVSATSRNFKPQTQTAPSVKPQSAPAVKPQSAQTVTPQATVSQTKQEPTVKSKPSTPKHSPREPEPVIHQVNSGLIRPTIVKPQVEEKAKTPNWSQEPFNSIVGNFTEMHHCERRLAIGLLNEQYEGLGSDEQSCDWPEVFIEAGKKLKLIKEGNAKPPAEPGTAWSTVGATEAVKSKPATSVKPPPKVITAPNGKSAKKTATVSVSQSEDTAPKPLTNISFYKAIYCRNMKEKGQCPYGQECYFAHTNKELRQHPSTVRKSHPDPTVQNRYSNPSLREAESNRKAFVGALAQHTTKQGLDQYFRKFGSIVDSVVMVKDGKPRGFGFVTYSKPEELTKMLESGPHRLDGKTVDAKHVTVMDDDSQSRYAGPGKNFMVGIDKEKCLKDENKRGQITSAKQKARHEGTSGGAGKRSSDQHGEQHVSDQECIFCMEQLIDCKRLDCGHDRFHLECISRWVNEQNASCPICRHPAKLPDLFKAPAGMKPEEFPALPM